MADKKNKTFEVAKNGRPSPKKCYEARPLTQQRIDHFLQVLSETGSRKAAAKSATPWSKGMSPGYSTFQKLWKKDPEFLERCNDAYDQFLGRMNEEITRRAFEPTSRPIFHLGEQVGEELKYDNNLLMQVAKARQHEVWGTRTELEITGQITHGVMVVGALPASEEEWEAEYALGEGAVDAELVEGVAEDADTEKE